MTTLQAVIAACLESGTLLVAFLALVILPFAIWLLSRSSLPSLRDIGNDRTRALFAGSLAIAPGASFAVASVVVIARAIRAGCLEMPGGRAVVAVITLLLALAFARALVRAHERFRLVERSIGRATPAASRLAGLTAVGETVPVFEIDTEEPLIFVAGSLHPKIYVSSGALERLDDVELRAALAHERAHVRHGDQAIMSALVFCTDLVPLDVDPLTEVYRDAREFAADRAAIATNDPLDLASAILRVVAPRRDRPIAALADACVKARISWLLGGARRADAAIPSLLKFLTIAQLALVAALATAAVVLPACRIVV
ncbi:MAG: hypothetical protein NVSMB21_09810 [Vulcanimicrobiaceae bacterium]